MNGINLDALEDSEADIDLRRCPAEQVGILLDLVRFDRFLDYVYVTLLKRAPDREGRVHYRQLARKGMSRPSIVRRLLRSREYQASSVSMPGLAVDEFVNRAYQDILGRWPDQNGLDTYRRIASKLNGRRRVLANLRASNEAMRKNGGRLGRIDVLHDYARADWPTRIPVVGSWFAGQRRLHQRLDRLSLKHYILAQEVASLREQVEAASLFGGEFGFAIGSCGVSPDGSSGANKAYGGSTADTIFHNALNRARRGA